ncbi:MAG: peptidoglycan recognition protein family protein [Planctomycetota bacterium]|jgi:hypothetical protein
MFSRLFIVSCCLFVLGGCAYNDEPKPEITHNLPEVVLPPVNKTIENPSGIGNVPRDWLPPSRVQKKWTAIVIHHSATKNGNSAIFDRWHRENKYWDGVGYNFVIGNGTNSGDGQVEVTFRWRKQTVGAHCGGTPNNWANKDGIGICLVGNFNQTGPTRRQMQSLLKLIRFLQNRYRIPKSRVYSHKTTPGARATDCPGKRFSMGRLKTMLDF